MSLFRRTAIKMLAMGSLLFAIGLLPGERAHSQLQGKQHKVIFTTNLGAFVVELYPDKAPISVKNFLDYVDSGFFDNTIFHRVIPGFMIQGGGFGPDLKRKKTRSPIKNEADNGLKNKRGTLSMARTNEIHSAMSQFFISVKNNDFLDHGTQDFGYAVFARVIAGMEVVDKIAAVPTGNSGYMKNIPKPPVVIQSARREPEPGKPN